MRTWIPPVVLSALSVLAPAQGATPAPPPESGGQRVERIQVEDTDTRINEVRYGGRTQSITVQPKNSALPEYEVLPGDATRSRATGRDDGAVPPNQRVWNVFKF